MSIYDSLNKEQRDAVTHTEGPVLILAGAGSGKTRVITHRIAYLIGECNVDPWNILAITFTNKAAGEMRERVDRLVGEGADRVWVSTFHSMCVRILRRHIDLIGYDTGFTIYDSDDSKTLMKQVMKTLSIDPKELREKTILSAVSAAKNQLETPLKFRESHTWNFQEKQIADAYEEYQKQLHKNNALDFDDLLMKTVELFTSHDEVLLNYQNRFRYIMVDEYQDTNKAQFELVRLLAEKNRNLCVVGDDDQSIYRFRGADIRNILDFEKVFPDTFVVRLEQNYRSTQNILNAANAVIHNNVNRKQKALWTSEGEGEKVRVRILDNAPAEASFIAGDVRRTLRENPRLHYRDFAVLYRTNAQSRALEESFVMESLPYRVVGGTNFYARREIKDLLSYLKTIDNAEDDLAVRRILNVPRRGIGKTSEEKVQQYAAEHDIGFFTALEHCNEISALSKGTAAKIKPFTDLIHAFRSYMTEHDGEEDRLSGLVKKILEDTDYEEELRDTEEEDVEDRLENIEELLTKVVTFEEGAKAGETELSLSEFLSEVALVADIDEAGEDEDRVLLMTLHSSKGLEFSRVYIAGMEDGVFPGQMSIDSGSEEDMEEERRLAYVGITRAKEELTITGTRVRMIHGEMRMNPVSRFVREIPEDLFDRKLSTGRSYREEEDEDEYSSRRDSYGGYGRSYGNTYVTYGNVGREKKSAPVSNDHRLKAIYRKPTTSEERKPFLAKANESRMKLSDLKKGSPVSEKPDYIVGDRVLHVKFGEGTVKEMEDTPRDVKVTVDFDDYGTKVMYAAFAKLKKVIE